MKKTRVLTLSIIAMAINLAACQKTPEEKIADTLIEMKNEKKMEHDKEIERMNEIRKQGQGYSELLEKSGSADSKKATKGPRFKNEVSSGRNASAGGAFSSTSKLNSRRQNGVSSRAYVQ